MAARPKITHSSERITPELAQKWMEAHNNSNRPISDRHVRLLAQDMGDGNFPENGENGVTFDWNDNIAGGQHTLMAIIRSGKTLTLRVTRGVDPSSRATMNDSWKQRLDHDLAVWGIRDTTDSAALLRKIVIWESVAKDSKGQGGLRQWRNTRFSRAHLITEWPKYATGITAAIQGAAKYIKDWPKGGNLGSMFFMYWLVTEKYGYSQEAAHEFFDHVCFGSQREGRTFQRLWARFQMPDERFADRQVFWLCRVWNAWLLDEKLTKLQEPKGGITDPYPRLRRP